MERMGIMSLGNRTPRQLDMHRLGPINRLSEWNEELLDFNPNLTKVPITYERDLDDFNLARNCGP